jgi:hypothetical protein
MLMACLNPTDVIDRIYKSQMFFDKPAEKGSNSLSPRHLYGENSNISVFTTRPIRHKVMR